MQNSAVAQAAKKEAVIEAYAPIAAIRKAYNIFSFVYGPLGGPLEGKPRLLALDRAQLRPDDKVLDVAVGPGLTLIEVLKRVDRTNVVFGVDLSPRMLDVSRKRVRAAGYSNIDLREADARQLPFPDESFDVVFNSYMLDLIPRGDMSHVLQEFRRVLRPNGRLVLVNLSKPDKDRRTWGERLYQALPKAWVPYVTGGCRPVLMRDAVVETGFIDVHREFVRNIVPSEIVTARKSM